MIVNGIPARRTAASALPARATAAANGSGLPGGGAPRGPKMGTGGATGGGETSTMCLTPASFAASSRCLHRTQLQSAAVRSAERSRWGPQRRFGGHFQTHTVTKEVREGVHGVQGVQEGGSTGGREGV
jgi:hypothetical protein